MVTSRWGGPFSLVLPPDHPHLQRDHPHLFRDHPDAVGAWEPVPARGQRDLLLARAPGEWGHSWLSPPHRPIGDQILSSPGCPLTPHLLAVPSGQPQTLGGCWDGCLAADPLLPFSEQLLVSGSLLVESEKRENILLVRGGDNTFPCCFSHLCPFPSYLRPVLPFGGARVPPIQQTFTLQGLHKTLGTRWSHSRVTGTKGVTEGGRPRWLLPVSVTPRRGWGVCHAVTRMAPSRKDGTAGG